MNTQFDPKHTMSRTQEHILGMKNSRNLSMEQARLHQVTDTTKRTSGLPSVLSSHERPINNNSTRGSVLKQSTNQDSSSYVRRPWKAADPLANVNVNDYPMDGDQPGSTILSPAIKNERRKYVADYFHASSSTDHPVVNLGRESMASSASSHHRN